MPTREKSLSNKDNLVAIDHELFKLNHRYDELDRLSLTSKDPTADTYREHEMDDLLDRIEALRSMISAVKATSAKGVMVQMRELFKVLDLAFNGPLDVSERNETNRKCRRLIFSMSGALNELFADELNGNPAKEENAHLDPWHHYEPRLAKMRGKAPLKTQHPQSGTGVEGKPSAP